MTTLQEAMVAGFSLRAIIGYLNSNDINGLQGEWSGHRESICYFPFSAFLLNSNVSIDETDEDGWSSLIHACVLGKTQAALTLIESGAELDLKDAEGCTALHHSAREAQTDCVRLLVEKGACVAAKDSKWSQTPFLWACYIGNVDMASFLLDHGSDVNCRGLHHCTGLVWAAGKSNLGLVRLLLEAGAKVDTGDKYGTTPLIWVRKRYMLDGYDFNIHHTSGMQKG